MGSIACKNRGATSISILRGASASEDRGGKGIVAETGVLAERLLLGGWRRSSRLSRLAAVGRYSTVFIRG